MPIETEMSENARALAIASRAPGEGQSAADAKLRAEGEFLRHVVAQLQPMLRESMRSHRIFLGMDDSGFVLLKSDGVFVHVDVADQEDLLAPLQVLQAEPNLRKILSRVEAELVAACDTCATRAADIVRLARYSLEAAAT